MEKRGISHIEVVISFIIFMGFVVFALYFFSPTDTTRLVDSTMTYAISEIKKNASVEVESYSMIIAGINPEDNGKSIEIDIGDVSADKIVRVEDKYGNSVPSIRIGNVVRFEIEGGFSGGGQSLIIDNEDGEPNYANSDSWSASNGADPYNDNSTYANSPGRWAKWSTDTLSGKYKVYAWWTYASSGSRSESAPYRIYNGESLLELKRVNQNIEDNGGQWNLLGEYSFNDVPNVTLTSESSSSYSADAIKFESSGSANEIIIDNDDLGLGFIEEGYWPVSGGETPYNSDSLYSKELNAEASWGFWNIETGSYLVYAWWTYADSGSRSEDAPYSVYNGGDFIETVRVNQNDSDLAGQWNLLGQYHFDTDAKIKINVESGDTYCADAVRIVKLGEDTNENIPKIKFGYDFDSSETPSSTVVGAAYKISSSEKIKVISEKRMLLLNETYHNEHEKLRQEFNLPGRVNFGFVLEFDSGDVIKAETFIPGRLDVFSEEERVEILRENGEIEYGNLIIKIW